MITGTIRPAGERLTIAAPLDGEIPGLSFQIGRIDWLANDDALRFFYGTGNSRWRAKARAIGWRRKARGWRR